MKTSTILAASVALLMVASIGCAAAEPRDGRTDVFVSLAGDFDPLSPIVRIRYHLVSGTTPVSIIVPQDDGEFKYWASLKLIVDGKPATLIDPKSQAVDPAWKRIENLEPGHSVEFDVPLAKIYKIPEAWTSMEVIPPQKVFHDGYTASLKIENSFPAIPLKK